MTLVLTVERQRDEGRDCQECSRKGHCEVEQLGNGLDGVHVPLDLLMICVPESFLGHHGNVFSTIDINKYGYYMQCFTW